MDIVTVFAGSPNPPTLGWWDALCGFDDSAEAARVRREEERAALEGLPHRLTFMPLVDDQYADHRSGAEPRQIAAEVASWVAEAGRGVVGIPAGAGAWRSRLSRILRRERPAPPQHPDHLLVRDAVLDSWASDAGWTPLLYEEFPYSLGGRAELRRPATELEIEIDPGRKAQRIARHASQVPHMSPPGTRLDDPAMLPDSERYWLLTG